MNDKPRLSVSEMLRAIPVFAGFADADREAVARFCHVRSFTSEEILFREGEASSAVYCLVSGLVKLYVSGSDHHSKVVEFVTPGRTFGEAAMFSDQGYPVTAVALDDSQVIAMGASPLMGYLREYPDLAYQMLTAMGRRLYHLVGQVRSLSLRDSEQRLAAYLLENYDPEEPARPVFQIPVMRSELASMLGQTAETLSRGVAKFRREGWIGTVDYDIVVRDPEALQAIVSRPRR